jgi:hypothetical protein
MIHTSINLGRLTFIVHDVLVACQDDDSHKRPHEATPSLVREDVCEHGPALTDRGTVARHGGRHRVISANTHAK